MADDYSNQKSKIKLGSQSASGSYTALNPTGTGQIAEAVDSVAETVKSYTKTADDVNDYVQAEPVKSVLWALAIGFILGKVL